MPLLAALLGCALAAPGLASGRRPSPVPTRAEDDPKVTLVLRAMNTNRERTSIDVEISIDGTMAIRDRLTSESSMEISIPPSKTFPLKIPRGKHTLRARSSEANAAIERDIEIRKKHWALLSYEPGQDGAYRFTLTFQDEPIDFQ